MGETQRLEREEQKKEDVKWARDPKGTERAPVSRRPEEAALGKTKVPTEPAPLPSPS